MIVGEGVDQHRRVHDDQRRSLSVLRCSAAVFNPTLPPDLPPARANTSVTVGRLAKSLRTNRRYSCSDIPASAARRRSTACVFSGTSLTWTFFMKVLCMQSMHNTRDGVLKRVPGNPMRSGGPAGFSVTTARPSPRPGPVESRGGKSRATAQSGFRRAPTPTSRPKPARTSVEVGRRKSRNSECPPGWLSVAPLVRGPCRDLGRSGAEEFWGTQSGFRA
jgi:hypothetical protein